MVVVVSGGGAVGGGGAAACSRMRGSVKGLGVVAAPVEGTWLEGHGGLVLSCLCCGGGRHAAFGTRGLLLEMDWSLVEPRRNSKLALPSGRPQQLRVVRG